MLTQLVAYQEFLYLSLDGGVGPHVFAFGRRRVNFSGKLLASPGHSALAFSRHAGCLWRVCVCERWSSWFSATITPPNKKHHKNLESGGEEGMWHAGKTQLERKEAAPEAGRAALPSHPVVFCLFLDGDAGFQGAGFLVFLGIGRVCITLKMYSPTRPASSELN